MTLPTSYSWFPRGERLLVPYQASEGRRVNVIGALFTHGPEAEADRLQYQVWAALPKSRAKKHRLSTQERAAAHGLRAEEVGPIDAARFVTFVWHLAGRPDQVDQASPGWVRARPLTIVLDNYSVHKSQTVAGVRPEWEAAGIQLLYLPAYSPELSAIEPIWHDVKQHRMPTRSFAQVVDLKHAVEAALTRKAHLLRHAPVKTTNILRAAA